MRDLASREKDPGCNSLRATEARLVRKDLATREKDPCRNPLQACEARLVQKGFLRLLRGCRKTQQGRAPVVFRSPIASVPIRNASCASHLLDRARR